MSEKFWFDTCPGAARQRRPAHASHKESDALGLGRRERSGVKMRGRQDLRDLDLLALACTRRVSLAPGWLAAGARQALSGSRHTRWWRWWGGLPAWLTKRAFLTVTLCPATSIWCHNTQHQGVGCATARARLGMRRPVVYSGLSAELTSNQLKRHEARADRAAAARPGRRNVGLGANRPDAPSASAGQMRASRFLQDSSRLPFAASRSSFCAGEWCGH